VHGTNAIITSVVYTGFQYEFTYFKNTLIYPLPILSKLIYTSINLQIAISLTQTTFYK